MAALAPATIATDSAHQHVSLNVPMGRSRSRSLARPQCESRLRVAAKRHGPVLVEERLASAERSAWFSESLRESLGVSSSDVAIATAL